MAYSTVTQISHNGLVGVSGSKIGPINHVEAALGLAQIKIQFQKLIALKDAVLFLNR